MERGSNPVLLSLGGNLGDVASTFDRAAAELERNGFHIWKRSGVYRSAAMGCEEGAPDFLNCSILGEWNDTLFSLLERIHRIEEMFGRPADHPHWVSRPLDIDILVMGELKMNTARLTIPHPEIEKRDFVVLPSAEIAPELVIPGLGKTFARLAGEMNASLPCD